MVYSDGKYPYNNKKQRRLLSCAIISIRTSLCLLLEKNIILQRPVVILRISTSYCLLLVLASDLQRTYAYTTSQQLGPSNAAHDSDVISMRGSTHLKDATLPTQTNTCSTSHLYTTVATSEYTTLPSHGPSRPPTTCLHKCLPIA